MKHGQYSMALLCSVRRWRYIVLVTITVHTVIAFRCMFDIVKPRRVVQTNISYLVIEDVCSNDADRCKRHASNRPIVEDLFQPIRIHAHFSSSTEINIDAVQRTRLRAVISRLVTISAHIFSVVPVDGPLLLGRSGCSKVWYTGVNTNRCATAKIGYHAEYCIDAFEIPAEHLEGLYIWNSEDPEPMLTVFDAGNGLVNTDYIIYIQSSYTSACLQGGLNVIAYASHCQLDQHGRPIAGYINICPQMLSDENYDEEKIYWTALHELFHALGFSADLFPSFQRCTFTERSNALSCEPYSSSVVKLIHGAYRLVTPKVSRLSSQHFGCHLETDVFGPMLQTLSGVVSSHWDAAFMHGSIMMPTITSPHLMLIDNITLAIFEDSGWYRVNYTCADNFIWGQGRGCDFALNPHCDDAADGVYFCRGSSRGCHYLHQDKATCDTTPFLHSCRIYRPNAQDNCQTESQSQVVDAAEDETFGETSRCFVSNLTKVSLVAGVLFLSTYCWNCIF